MTMSRRGFLKGLIGIAAAPAICKAENLMKIVVPDQSLMVSSGLYQHLLSSKHIDRTLATPQFAADFDGDVINTPGDVWSYYRYPDIYVHGDSMLLSIMYPIIGTGDVLSFHELQHSVNVVPVNELRMT